MKTKVLCLTTTITSLFLLSCLPPKPFYIKNNTVKPVFVNYYPKGGLVRINKNGSIKYPKDEPVKLEVNKRFILFNPRLIAGQEIDFEEFIISFDELNIYDEIGNLIRNKHDFKKENYKIEKKGFLLKKWIHTLYIQ